MTTVTSVIATNIAQPPLTPVPATPGPSCAAWDAGCQAGQIAQTGFQSLVAEIARGTGQFVVSATTWWTTTPSVDPLDPAVGHAQTLLQPLSLTILVGSILAQAIRMMISRKGDPLVQVLLGLVRYAVTTGLGLTILHAALRAGDALATGILDDAAAKFALLMQAMLLANPTNLWGVLLLSLDRDGAGGRAVAADGAAPGRAAGAGGDAAPGRVRVAEPGHPGWLDRLIGWLLAIVAYKPAAAFIYYLGFSYLSPRAGAPGNLGTILTGVMVLRLAVVAMPVLLKFFSWSGTQIGGSGGSGSGTLAAAGAVALARAGRGPGVDRGAALTAAAGPAGAPSRRPVRLAAAGRGAVNSSPAHHARVAASHEQPCGGSIPPTAGSRGCTGTGAPNAAGASVAVDHGDHDGVPRRAGPVAGGVDRTRRGAAAGRGRCRRGGRDRGPDRGPLGRGRARGAAAVLAGPTPRLDPAVGRGARRRHPRRRPARRAGPAAPAGCRRRPRRPARPAVQPPHRHLDRGPALLPDRAGSRRL